MDQSGQGRKAYLSFSQDSSCFAVGTQFGFHVFNSFPLVKSISRDTSSSLNGSNVVRVELLLRSSLMGISSDVQPKRSGNLSTNFASRNKVTLWDDNQQKPAGELSFVQPVVGVRLAATLYCRRFAIQNSHLSSCWSELDGYHQYLFEPIWIMHFCNPFTNYTGLSWSNRWCCLPQILSSWKEPNHFWKRQTEPKLGHFFFLYICTFNGVAVLALNNDGSLLVYCFWYLAQLYDFFECQMAKNYENFDVVENQLKCFVFALMPRLIGSRAQVIEEHFTFIECIGTAATKINSDSSWSE